jgi:hypothetical protein
MDHGAMADNSNADPASASAPESGRSIFQSQLIGAGDQSLDEMLDAELGKDRHNPAPKGKGKVQSQQPRKPQPRAEEEDLDEDDDLDEDEDNDEDEDDSEFEDEDEDSDEDLDDPDDDDEDDSEDDEDDLDDEEDEDEDEDNSEDDEEEDEEEPKKKTPKGLEALAKDKSFGWAAKRIQKQSNDIAALRTALAQDKITLQPTSDFPLVGIKTDAELTEYLKAARVTRKSLNALDDEDFSEEGEVKVTDPETGKKVIKTKAEVQAEIAELDALLDGDAPDQHRRYLAYREQTKPWQKASAICPEAFQPGTTQARIYDSVLALCPAMAATVGDHEVVLARAIRDMMRDHESAPTKEYPKGRFKWVRYELDRKGKVKAPQQQQAEKGGKKAVHKQPRITSTPTSGRPTQQPRQGGKSKSKAPVFTGMLDDNQIAAAAAAELRGWR